MQENEAKPRMSAPIDVQRVRRLFNRSEKVAASSFLRREIAHRMHERLDLIKLAPSHVLDAGCGEGADLPLLQQRFEAAQMIAVDGS
ncbi:MAG: SAM-dependent methyltransferase, partial [Burkholderiales bacterium]|nr:SAM-dependent methyltransferase [Burkholderiales bacterium]